MKSLGYKYSLPAVLEWILVEFFLAFAAAKVKFLALKFAYKFRIFSYFHPTNYIFFHNPRSSFSNNCAQGCDELLRSEYTCQDWHQNLSCTHRCRNSISSRRARLLSSFLLSSSGIQDQLSFPCSKHSGIVIKCLLYRMYL